MRTVAEGEIGLLGKGVHMKRLLILEIIVKLRNLYVLINESDKIILITIRILSIPMKKLTFGDGAKNCLNKLMRKIYAL